MSGFQWFSIAIALFCVLYGTKIWIEARIDKDDPMYGQSIVSVIWAYLLALFVLLEAFGNSWS